MHTYDLTVILLYLGLLIYVGIAQAKKSKETSDDFILAGRKLSLPAFVATLVATWYGGILGIGENTYLQGIQTWFIFGLPYYFFGLLFALFLAKRVHKAKRISIPDHFHHHYGKTSGILSAFYILILSSPAPYILSIGVLIQFSFGLPLGVSLLSASGLSLFYIWFGGFRAVVRTDMLQFILMFSGFIFLFIFSWIKAGPPTAIFVTLPSEHLNPSGGMPIQYIVVWSFIAMWTFVDPGFYQRCAAAKSGATAQKGIFISLSFWFFFDMLTLITGLYAKALLPESDALFSFPQLGAKVLPPVVYGIFITGILSTIMSTIDSLGLINAVTFGRDILWRIQSPTTETQAEWDKTSTAFVKKGLVAMTFLALILAVSIPSVIKLWYGVGSIIVPGLLIPFLLTFTSEKISSQDSLQFLALPVIVSATWFILGKVLGSYPVGLEPFYPGMVISICLLIIHKYLP